MKRLNIFVDETGEFGFGKNSSKLYGVSFVFHEQNHDIKPEIKKLNERLTKIGYNAMIHTADLILRHGDYCSFDIKKRKSIFKAIYHFSRKIPVKFKSIFVDKKYTDINKVLKNQLSILIQQMLNDHEKYFKKFDKIVMYYDNGQETLGVILDTIFSRFEGFEHRVHFNHQEKKLFQVADMLTFIDKYNYKYNKRKQFSKSEKYFFNDEEIRKVLSELKSKKL